jgi:hypothetical protein
MSAVPSPLTVRRIDHMRSRMKGSPAPPDLPPDWPPPDWEGNDYPLNDSHEAVLEWFDLIVAALPHIARRQRVRAQVRPDSGGYFVRDAYRLLRHLRDQGRTTAEDDEELGRAYTPHDALIVLRRVRDRLIALRQSAPQARKATAAAKRKRMTVEEANQRAVQLAKAKRTFVLCSLREWAEAIGCSTGLVPKLPLWQKTMKRTSQSRADRTSVPKVVHTSESLDAVTGEGDRDEVLNRLIAEQEADKEPSSLDNDPPDSRPKRVRSRFRL